MAIELPWTQGRSGVVTQVVDGRPVDVSHLAAMVGLDCRVFFDPAVWAFCEPKVRLGDELLEGALRDQHARNILRSVHRGKKRFREGRLVFRPHGLRVPAALVAELDGGVDEPTLVIRVA